MVEEEMRFQPHVEECVLRLYRSLGEKEAPGFLAKYSAWLATKADSRALELTKNY